MNKQQKHESNLWIMLNQLNNEIKSKSQNYNSTIQYFANSLPYKLSPYSCDRINICEALYLINLGCDLVQINSKQSNFLKELIKDLEPYTVYTLRKPNPNQIFAINEELFQIREEATSIILKAHKIAPLL